jgi:excisionase family DNA binding protein
LEAEGYRGEEMSRLLTINEAAALTRLSVKTIYSYTCRRRIPFLKLGGAVRFDEDRLRKWIDEHVVEPVAAVS